MTSVPSPLVRHFLEPKKEGLLQIITTDNPSGIYVRKSIPSATRLPREGVLFLHGLESHSGWWDKLWSELQGRVDLSLIATDREGWGRSAGVPGHISNLDTLNQKLLDTIQNICPEIQVWHLVGMSWGGLWAMDLVEKHPRNWATVALLAPGLYPRYPSLKWPLNLAKALVKGGRTGVRLQFKPQDFCQSNEGQDFVAEDPYRGHTISGDFCRTTAKMQFRLQSTASPAISTIQAICLLPWQDNIIHLEKTRQYMWRHHIPVSTVYQSGHAMVLDQPTDLATKLINFWGYRDC